MANLFGDRKARARRRLTRLLSTGDADVVRAALWIAAEHCPDLDVAREARAMRQLALEGAARVEGLDNPFARLDGLKLFLYEELGFRGNAKDYDDPRNSYLNEVVSRRLGIPLTLSIVFIEVARAAGFEARGVGLPGHFVASVTWEGRTILVDPFHEGRVITEEDCRDLVGRSTGRPSLFRQEYLEGADGRKMLTRLLLNLKHVFLSSGEYDQALSVVDRLLLVSPRDLNEIRDRGFLKAHLGRPSAAITDLEQYLAMAPDAPDTKSVEGRLQWLKRRTSQAN